MRSRWSCHAHDILAELDLRKGENPEVNKELDVQYLILHVAYIYIMSILFSEA